MTSRAWFVPEVTQTSAMDCGPAALKAILDGYGLRVSYGRLRELCHTGIDGTSIDTIEEVACAFGLAAEQVVVPVDHVWNETDPALAVTVLPGGATHFVVVWRSVAGRVQLMDPRTGRRWERRRSFERSLYEVELEVEPDEWFEWASTPEFTDVLEDRIVALGVPSERARAIIERAAQRFDTLAVADAATRFAADLARESSGREWFETLVATPLPQARAIIPEWCWSALPREHHEGLLFRGAVLLRIRGWEGHPPEPSQLPDQLRHTVEDQAQRAPERLLWRTLCAVAGGPKAVGAMLGLGGLVAAGVTAEALLLRALIELPGSMVSASSQVLFTAMALALLVSTMGLTFAYWHGAIRLGRALEVDLRRQLREKLLRLHPRHFSSRLRSDLAERAHAIAGLRGFASYLVGGWSAALSLVFISAGLVWLETALLPAIAGGLVLVCAPPLFAQGPLRERDLRARSHAAALGQSALDALLGLAPIRAHSAQDALRDEHEGKLGQWLRAELANLRAVTAVAGAQALAGFAAIGLLGWTFWRANPSLVGMLLVAYWGHRWVAAARELANVVNAYPALRSVARRLDEILSAPEEPEPTREERGPKPQGAGLTFEEVSVVLGGRPLIRDVTLEIEPGEHVAIIGASGAGKSTLVGAILGLHAELGGHCMIDGADVTTRRFWGDVAWVDPTVQIWNSTLLENLRFGARTQEIGSILDAAELRGVLERQPEGLATVVGEGGRLLSGGEGQRVRLGRAFGRPDARLVLLDEAFRGLDRTQRARLIQRARQWWARSTLINVTHDIEEALDFDRIVVMHDGVVVEVGSPESLAAKSGAGGHFARLLKADRESRERAWGERWNTVWLGAPRDEGELQGKDLSSTTSVSLDSNAASVTFASPPNSRPAGIAAATASPPSWGWPLEETHLALRALVSRAAIAAPRGATSTPSRRADAAWIVAAAARLGAEARRVSATVSDFPEMLRKSAPLLLPLRLGEGEHQPIVLAAVHECRGSHAVVQTSRGTDTVPVDELWELALAPEAERHRDALAMARNSAPGADAGLERALLARIVGDAPICTAFALRPSSHTSLARNIWRSGAPHGVLVLMGLGTLSASFLALSWWVLGKGVLEGSVATAWLAAWVLLCASLAPIEAARTWVAGATALKAATALRLQSFLGALRIDPDKVRKHGVGGLMGLIFETEAASSLAISGGLAGIAAAIDLGLASLVFTQGVRPGLMIAGLAVWSGFVLTTAGYLWVLQSRWTDSRVALTADLVERMLGHLTRLIQSDPASRQDSKSGRHLDEDNLLHAYFQDARGFDRVRATAAAVFARGWLVFGIGLAAAGVVHTTPTTVAITLGGVLLGARGFAQLSAALQSVVSASIAWRTARPLLNAATNSDRHGLDVTLTTGSDGPNPEPVEATATVPPETLLEARGLTYTHRDRTEATLCGVDLEIRRGDRILLRGPSGCGKSTLAAIISGQRRPQGGWVTLRGYDLDVLGEPAWRRETLFVPQFHENHIVSGPLALNLLMGREWPPPPHLLHRAETVCRELGLGPLIERMPAGLNQMVGESGWALSHGERNRVFLARAILQGAEIVIFDETFAALDPETLAMVVDVVHERLETVVAIAHP